MVMQIQIPGGLQPGDLMTVNLVDGRQVQMQVPAGAGPGSVVQFEPPPVVVPGRAVLQSEGSTIPSSNPLASSIEMPSSQPEVRLNSNQEHDMKTPLAHAVGSAPSSQVVDESEYPNGDKDVVEYSLRAGLHFHDLVVTVWRTKDTVFSCAMQTIGPTLWKLIDADGDGLLTFDEIEHAMNGENSETEVQKYLRSVQCPVLNALASRDQKKTRQAFNKMDTGKNGTVDLNEWNDFLANVQKDRMNFYKTSFLLQDHVYAGLGMEPGTPSEACFYKEGRCFWRGWWEDFKYYTCNSHPLFVICFEDKLHPYSRTQRSIEFFGAFITTFFGGGIMLYFEELDFLSKMMLTIILINIPTTIYRKIVYLFLAAPCLLHDEAAHTESYNRFCCCCDFLLDTCGSIFACVWVIVFLITGILVWTSDGNDAGLSVWLIGIAQYWVIWFVVALLIDFNPSATISKLFTPCNCAVACLSCGLVNTRVGRWHLEREYVHDLIRAKVEERGVDKFYLPSGMRDSQAV